MIEEISIHNLGVIGEARLPLGPGFTAITGETGAGKTMVVTALGLLLGERADTAVIRSGSTQSVVEGCWLIEAEGPVAERVRDAGGQLEASPQPGRVQLILGRSVSPEGRSRAVIGGRTTPAGVLSEIGQQLVVVHGQSDQVRLRSSSAQRDALDRFGGAELAALLTEYRSAYRRWEANQAELDGLTAEAEHRRREAEDLRVAMAEIESVSPLAGEDEELADLAERLTNIENLRLAAAQAHASISGDDGGDGFDVLGQLEAAKRQLERVAGHDAALGPIVAAMTEVGYLVSEISVQLSSYLAGLDADHGRELETVQERRAALGVIARKYGPSLAEALEYFESGAQRLLELDGDTDRIDALTDEVQRDRARVVELAERLTERRGHHARRLSDLVTAELAALAMPQAQVTVEVEDLPDYTLTGKDQVAILLRPHPGAEPRPIGRGASGGELSRIMLAIEVVIAGSDPVPTFIFDEVDAGVGGAAAIEVGRRLAALAETAQVIVVTHLAQVAAFATNHLRVSKDSDGEVTASSVAQLRGEERIAEMARLLSGLPDSASGLTHARELIETARSLS